MTIPEYCWELKLLLAENRWEMTNEGRVTAEAVINLIHLQQQRNLILVELSVVEGMLIPGDLSRRFSELLRAQDAVRV